MADKKEQNKKYVEASRYRDKKHGIIRVEVRVPSECRDEIISIAKKMLKNNDRLCQK